MAIPHFYNYLTYQPSWIDHHILTTTEEILGQVLENGPVERDLQNYYRVHCSSRSRLRVLQNPCIVLPVCSRSGSCSVICVMCFVGGFSIIKDLGKTSLHRTFTNFYLSVNTTFLYHVKLMKFAQNLINPIIVPTELSALSWCFMQLTVYLSWQDLYLSAC